MILSALVDNIVRSSLNEEEELETYEREAGIIRSQGNADAEGDVDVAADVIIKIIP